MSLTTTELLEKTEKILLTPREAAEALGLSERKLWDLSAPRGPVPTVRIGKAVRYRRQALEDFVRSQESAA